MSCKSMSFKRLLTLFTGVICVLLVILTLTDWRYVNNVVEIEFNTDAADIDLSLFDHEVGSNSGSIRNQNNSLLQYGKHCEDTHNRSRHRHAVIAGLYNTGTNALANALMTNCNYTGFRFWWQPQWGKHEIFSMRKLQYWNAQNLLKANPAIHDFYARSLFIVMVKHPLTWMRSMCKANYDFRYVNHSWFSHCPQSIHLSALNWIPSNRAHIHNINRTSNGFFQSMLHVYNLYYTQWLTLLDSNEYHVVFVKFEYFLFEPERVIDALCHCYGHYALKNDSIQIREAAAKPHGKPNNRTNALQVYADPNSKYIGFTPQDLSYIDRHVNRTIMETFDFHFDANHFLY